MSGRIPSGFISKASVEQAIDELRERLGLSADESSDSDSSRSITRPVAATMVRKYLREHALTQSAFAVENGIGERTLGRLIQNGKASKRIQKALAKGMRTTVKDLFGTRQ
jgi:hypothetical protein